LELKDKLNILNDRYKTTVRTTHCVKNREKNASKTPIIAPPPKLSKQPGTLSKVFTEIAKVTSREVGRAWVFALALGTVVVWAITGPLFNFSDTWQLVINTGTTIITFLMVFLIQNSQNRDSAAIQVKLDELIRVSKANSLEYMAHLADFGRWNVADNLLIEVSPRHRTSIPSITDRIFRTFRIDGLNEGATDE
jgi:uncharacterized membrane protein